MHLAEIRVALVRPRTLRIPHAHEVVHRGEHYLHMGYMGFVSWEQHYKWYGKAAALCLLFMIIAQFMHEADE